MDDVDMLASFMVEFANLIYKPVAEEKYGNVLDEMKDVYLVLGAQAMAMGEEEKFVKALIELCDFAREQTEKVLK